MFYNIINCAGVISLLQAVIQVVFSSISIAQYFCVIDFLNNTGSSILLKILYYINPDTCGNTVNIGNAIQGIPNQAFVLFRSEPVTSTRTYIINVTSLVLACIWAIACCLLLAGGTRNQYPRSLRWPWITATVCICVVDVVASVTYANDSFHTESLVDIMAYIGATASGIGGTTVDTSSTAWTMVLVYSRCVVMFVINVALTVIVAMHENEKKAQSVETPSETSVISVPPPMTLFTENPISDDVCDKVTRYQNNENNREKTCKNIPRANLSQDYQKMKKKLMVNFQKNKPTQKHEIALELAKHNLETRANHQVTNRTNQEMAADSRSEFLTLADRNPRAVYTRRNSKHLEMQPWSYLHYNGAIPEMRDCTTFGQHSRSCLSQTKHGVGTIQEGVAASTSILKMRAF